MNLEVSKSKSGDLTIMQVTGKILSQEEVDLIDDALYTEIEESEGKPKIILDLEGLSHTNSTGLNHFIRYFTKCRNKGGELVMINPSPSVAKLFEITKLIDVFTVAENMENAQQILNEL